MTESSQYQPPALPHVSDTSSQRKRKLWLLSGLALGLIVIMLAMFFSPYLTTKIAPGKKFKILGPSKITAGQTATVTWDASTESTKQYPYQKIEYCVRKALKEKCAVLATSAPNNGKAVVKVPASLPGNKGYLKFTARDPQKRLFGSMTSRSGAVTALPAEIASDSGGSDAGGGGGSGGSGSGGDSSGGGSTQSDPGKEALYLPIVPVSLCLDPSPLQVQFSYLADPAIGSNIGVRYREKETAEWKSGREHHDFGGPTHTAYLPIGIGEGKVELNKTYEIQFYADPTRTYEMSIGGQPTLEEQQRGSCIRHVTLPQPPNFAELPAGVTASNFQTRVDNGRLVLTFSTSLPVFLPQMDAQLRLQGGAWSFLGYEDTLGRSESFYRQSTNHTITFLAGSSSLVGQNPGSPFEFLLARHHGDPISAVYAFTSPGDSSLSIDVQFNPPVTERTKNGFLVRWKTSQPATSKVVTAKNETMNFDDFVISHVVPVVLPFVTTTPELVNFTLSSQRPATNEEVSRTGSNAAQDICSRQATLPTGLQLPAYSFIDNALCRIGIGPTTEMSAVAPNTPWAVYCNTRNAADPVRACHVCQFPGANFAAASCAPTTGSQTIW